MRVAILHDFFGAIGGGERTVLTLARAWHAPVYTTEVNRASIERLGFGDVRLTSLGPVAPRAPLKQIAASFRFAVSNVDADAYLLSGNWATYAARRHHPNVMYCYTPVRAFYDTRDSILRRQPSAVHRGLVRGWVAVHRAADRIAWTHVDEVVAISENTRRRIRLYMGRDARVVYPPTEVSRHRFEALEDFWLSVNRLYPEKRVEMQFEVFRRLPRERLVVVGGYAEGDHARDYVARLRPPPNVELLGEVDDAELLRLYARCRGVICTALDEDFGLTPVEAMASGKVALAVDEGGFRESIVPGETGWLLPADPEAFAERIRDLRDEDLASRSEVCRQRAQKFDVHFFIDRMRTVLEEAVAA